MERPDLLALQILAVFEGPDDRTVSLESLAKLADPSADSATVAQCFADLLARGWLRAAPCPETYARTEDGRLQLAGPLDVTLYSRPGCHLCDEAKAQIEPVLRQFGARLTQINIDDDEQLRERYGHDIPVIFLGARKVAKHRVDSEQFRRQLRDAARSC